MSAARVGAGPRIVATTLSARDAISRPRTWPADRPCYVPCWAETGTAFEAPMERTRTYKGPTWGWSEHYHDSPDAALAWAERVRAEVRDWLALRNRPTRARRGGWKRGRVVVALDNRPGDDSVTVLGVPAWRCPDAPGLVVHQAAYWDDDGEQATVPGSNWRISHDASGLHLWSGYSLTGYLPTLASAKDAALQLARLSAERGVRWDVPPDAARSGAHRAVIDAMKAQAMETT